MRMKINWLHFEVKGWKVKVTVRLFRWRDKDWRFTVENVHPVQQIITMQCKTHRWQVTVTTAQHLYTRWPTSGSSVMQRLLRQRQVRALAACPSDTWLRRLALSRSCWLPNHITTHPRVQHGIHTPRVLGFFTISIESNDHRRSNITQAVVTPIHADLLHRSRIL